MKKAALIKQRDITDCGASCLASIAGYYDLKLPVSRIRQIAGTDQKGTNIYGMVEAAEKMGFSAKGVKGDLEALMELPTPVIAHVVKREIIQHYVVIYAISKTNGLKVMDPETGKIEIYAIETFQNIWSGVLILLTPSEKFEKGNQKISINSRFWFLLKPHKAVLIQSIVGATFFTLIGLTTAIYVQKIVDFVIPTGNSGLLNVMSAAMLGLLVIQVLLRVYKSIFIFKTGQSIDAKLILGYYKHILSLPQRFFDTMRVGEIMSRIGDAVKIRTFINEVGITILINVFVVLFSFCLLFTYYWKLALMVLVIIPLYIVIYLISNQLNKKVERRVMEHAAELEAQLVESLNSVKTIKSFGMEDYTNLKTESRFINLLTSVYTSGMNGVFTGNATFVISRTFTISMLWLGSYHVLNQTITPGELMSFYAIIGYFTGPISSLIGANKSFQNARIAADRLFEIMDLENDDAENRINITSAEIGDIIFEGVTFNYGTRVNVFENLNLVIKKGQLTAVVGKSGSGKSTLAGIIKQLYPIDEGKVSIGNYDLATVSKDSINRIIGIVPQQVDLFAGTVIENIALGKFDADTKKIMRLAEEIGAMEFIHELPGGLNSLLGENGINLSGGQRQRLAILRALYNEPDILIFDEATSALDHGAENLVINTMTKLRNSGKMVIAITHRSYAAEMADQVIYMEKGKIVGIGSHSNLLSKSETYKSHWHHAQEMIEN